MNTQCQIVEVLFGTHITNLGRRVATVSHSLRTVAAPLLAAALALLPAAAQAQAIEAWVQRYSGPGNYPISQDWAETLAVDTNGNVYVAGVVAMTGLNDLFWNNYLTIKYSSTGVPLWTNSYDGPVNHSDTASAMAMDTSGNVYVTGGSRSLPSVDYLTIKYSSAGVPLWTNRGPAGNAWALALDTNGDVVVTGSAESGSGDYLTIKYSSTGTLLWAKTYNGPANGADFAQAVAVDASGNVVVTGCSGGIGTGNDYATIAYSSAGAPLWTNRYSGTGNGDDSANALAVDADGNVFVTGISYNGSNNTYATIKYSSAGMPVWTNFYGIGEATTLVVDASGNVVVTGGNPDYATIKYSSAGVPLWTNLYLKPGNSGSTARAVALDARGNVFVTGTENEPGWPPTAADWVTIAYSSAGLPLWTNRYNGPENSMDNAYAIALDVSGNVYAAGRSRSSITGDDMLVVKYVVPPVIAHQPLSRTNAVGTTASFTVEAAGGAPLTYQWRRQETNLLDGPNLSGVTTTNLLIANVQPADAAGYSVVVTNAYGSTTSSVAQLTVYIPANPGRFTDLSYSPATGFSFVFREGALGRTYRIQISPSLAEGSWMDWLNFTYIGPISIGDLSAPDAERRFYRAVSP